MNRKINRIMNVLIVVSIGFFTVDALTRFWDFKNHPEIYEAQSAPWHVALLIPGAASLILLLIALVVKIRIRKKS